MPPRTMRTPGHQLVDAELEITARLLSDATHDNYAEHVGRLAAGALDAHQHAHQQPLGGSLDRELREFADALSARGQGGEAERSGIDYAALAAAEHHRSAQRAREKLGRDAHGEATRIARVLTRCAHADTARHPRWRSPAAFLGLAARTALLTISPPRPGRISHDIAVSIAAFARQIAPTPTGTPETQ